MSCSSKAIICDEIFDENSLPSEQEVRDYAVKIGINPDTEKHLLNIALDGLMSPLPEEWKACLDERINRIYYYNAKTHQTQWTHPLDEHFENLVKKKRQEESISAGDDDSKTSIKEDLKSFEEAVTTSDMMSSRNPATTHKSRLTSPSKQQPLPSAADPSPDGRKLLNPIGRPPLPPKRRAASTSPKRGLSLRLSPGPAPPPAPGRIDIDSIGVPVGLPSPSETKGEKPGARSPGIKLTGGGSAFLKSKQKQSPSPSDEIKKVSDESDLKSFEIVREAESIESPDDEKGEVEDRKLKHSTSLGESGFDKLIKSKKFMSLQESLSSLKSELELPSSDLRFPNTSGLRGILRDKPSPTAKLWDVDPALLTSEEKEKLRMQELKDERKQNVRFADIINKPINIEFSKSDSEDDSTTNDSSNDLDDLILENMHSDDELRKENKLLENSLKLDLKLDDNENTKADGSPESLTKDMSSPRSNKSNRNIISRLSDLSVDSTRKKGLTKKLETDNNNKEESDDWLMDTENIMNQNEKKIQAMRKNVYDITKLSWDAENNPIDKHLTEVGFAKTQTKSPVKQASPAKKMQFMEIMNKELVDAYQQPGERMKREKSSFMDLKKLSDELSDDNGKLKDVRKSRLMPDVDLQKVFQSVKESMMNSSEPSESDDGEPMETSPLGPGGEDDPRRYRTDDRTWEKYNRQRDRKFQEYRERQRKVFEEKKAAVYQDYQDTLEEVKKELKRQESIERQRIHAEVQQGMLRYKEEVEAEKNERETEFRNQCEEYLKELEAMLTKDKEIRIQKIKEEHEMFMRDQEKRINEEKAHFEEEKKIRMHTSSSQLEKIVAELKEKEEQEILRLKEESKKKLEEIQKQIEQDQAEQEKRHKQELAIVEAEYERVVGDRRRMMEELRATQEGEVAATRAQHQAALDQLVEQHRVMMRQLQDQAREEEEFVRKKHAEKMEALNAQLNRTSEKEDVTQLNREFEKVRCEKRLLEDKYKSLKEKYVRLKSEVRLSMERKRQAKLNRQLQQQREPASTTEDTSADHGKPPLARKKLVPALSSDEGTGDNANGTPKTIKRRPKQTTSMTLSSTTADPSSSSAPPPHKPKNVWNPSPQLRREGVSSAEDNHTSVSEEIQLEQDDCGGQWTQSVLSPLENLRKQLEKLDDLEEQFPTSVHADTYLRYPFSGPGGSCELDFYRHRLHLEREAVRRAKQALAEQRLNIEARQLQLRHRQHSQTLNTLHQEERELTDMEVSLHRTRALLGEKIIRLRYLEQSIERAATFTPHHSHSHDSTTATNTDSSGFSGSDLELSNAGLGGAVRSEMFWTENVLQSLENINSEIREIWAILGKQQVPGLGPPPVLNYESRAIAGADGYGLAPHRATDIADRTRRLKEWLVRTREQQTHVIAPVTL